MPEKPTLADENSVEGLETFTEWWIELFNYGLATNDFKPLRAVTGPACQTCNNVQEANDVAFADAGWLVGGELEVVNFDSKFRVTVNGSIDSFLSTTQKALKVYDSSGAVVNEAPAYDEPSVSRAIAVFEDGAWVMTDFGSIKVEQ